MGEATRGDAEGRVRDLSCCISLDSLGGVKEFESVGSVSSPSNKYLRKSKSLREITALSSFIKVKPEWAYRNNTHFYAPENRKVSIKSFKAERLDRHEP